jgi:hypothetical protein
VAKPASGATLDSGHALATNLVLALPFTEGSGSTSQDVSAGGRVWTRGSISWATEGGDACISNADAANTGTLSSTLSIPGNQDWTFAWRSKHTGTTNVGILFGQSANTTDWVYHRNDAASRGIRFRDGSNNTAIIAVATSFSVSVEDHALVYHHSAQTIEYYRDGVLAGSAAATWVADIDIDSVIGGNNGALAHLGSLHYLYIWDGRALDSTELTALHADPYDFLDPPAPSDSITLTNPVMVQRSGTTGTLAVSGTYSASLADHVRSRVLLSADDSVVIDWATVDASLSGDVWSGLIASIPQGGPYKCQAHVRDSSNNILASVDDGPAFIVGEIVANAGQSNSTGRGTNLQSYTGSSVAWALQEEGSVDTTLSDPISNDGSAAGSWIPLLATLLSAKLGPSVPLGFYTYGRGGTKLDDTQWLPPDGATWQAADARFDEIGLNGVKCVLWLQGEADVALSVSTATYQAREVILAEAFAGWVGNPPMMSTLTAQQSTELDADMDDIRAAKLNNWNAGETLPGANTIDIDLVDGGGDGLHYKTNAELAELAARIYLALEEQFYGGTNGRGPRLVSATRSETTVTLLFDKDLESATTYTTSAFIYKDNATPVTVSSVYQAGTREVRLELAATPVGTETVMFGSGDDAVGATIPRAKATALPATINSISSVSLPAEPIYDVTVNVGQVTRVKNRMLMGVG